MNKANFFEMFGGAMIVSGISMSRIRSVFRTKPMLFLGKMSFSIYLLHVPLLYSLGCRMMMLLNDMGVSYILSTVLIFAVLTAVLIALSYVFSRYIETFCGKMVSKFLSLFAAERSTAK